MATADRAATCAFLTPFASLVALFIGLPFLLIFALSFTDLLLGERSAAFVGWRNYADLLGDAYFRSAFENSLMYTAIVLPGAVGLGLSCALAVARTRVLAPLYRTVFFMPVMACGVAMLLAWELFMHPDLGQLNQILQAFGFSARDWLNDPDLALFSLAAIGVWQLFGVNFLLFTAGLAQIPAHLYEAASLDGVDTPVSRFIHVTWPGLLPVAGFVILFTLIRTIQLLTAVQVLTQGGPGASTQVLMYYMYQEGFEFLEIGRASAAAVIALALIMIPNVLYRWRRQ